MPSHTRSQRSANPSTTAQPLRSLTNHRRSRAPASAPAPRSNASRPEKSGPTIQPPSTAQIDRRPRLRAGAETLSPLPDLPQSPSPPRSLTPSPTRRDRHRSRAEHHLSLRAETLSPLPEAPQSPPPQGSPSPAPSSNLIDPTKIHLVINFKKGNPGTVSRAIHNIPAPMEIDYDVAEDSLDVVIARIRTKLAGQDKLTWVDDGKPYVRPAHSTKHASFIEASPDNFKTILVKAWRKETARVAKLDVHLDDSTIKVHLFVYLTGKNASASAETLHRATSKRKAFAREDINAAVARGDIDKQGRIAKRALEQHVAKRHRPPDGNVNITIPPGETYRQAQNVDRMVEDHHRNQLLVQEARQREYKEIHVKFHFDGILHMEAKDLLQAVNLPPNFDVNRLYDFVDNGPPLEPTVDIEDVDHMDDE